MNATLYLPMKKKWYDMIFSGEKKEEYREFKPHWMTRVRNCTGESCFIHSSHETKDHGREESIVVSDFKSPPLEIWFVNGYQKNARRFKGYCDYWVVRSDAIHPEWGEGEYAGKPHFVFHISFAKREEH